MLRMSCITLDFIKAWSTVCDVKVLRAVLHYNRLSVEVVLQKEYSLCTKSLNAVIMHLQVKIFNCFCFGWASLKDNSWWGTQDPEKMSFEALGLFNEITSIFWKMAKNSLKIMTNEIIWGTIIEASLSL